MSFNIGLSGMRAASKDLNVTGNNIANAGTVGFKQSRMEFTNLYAASMNLGAEDTSSSVQGKAMQQFSQGSITTTQNTFDLAINGKGFFQVSNNGSTGYTRSGYFGTDKNGYIVDNYGNNLQGYGINANGNLQVGAINDLRVTTENMAPQATSQVTQLLNLNSQAAIPAVTPFDPTDSDSYNSSTSTNIYDAEGNVHAMTQYFAKDSANTWTMYMLIDGQRPNFDVDGAAYSTVPFAYDLSFDSTGKLVGSQPKAVTAADGTDVDTPADSSTAGVISFDSADWVPVMKDASGAYVANGAGVGEGFSFDMSGSTQYASTFAVNKVSQDGYTTGELSGVQVSDNGQIMAQYTNGKTKLQGQVLLVNFANEQGLVPSGNGLWAETSTSGAPLVNTPGAGAAGLIQSGALEDSNVELSEQLVNLIMAQRNYQANAKSIETESALTEAVINMR